MADESYVQVAQDSTGKKIRNLVSARVVLDGIPDADGDENRYVQVVALTDANGRLFESSQALLRELLAAQQRTNELLEAILDSF